MEDAAALAVLDKDVGTWDAEVVVRPGPGAPPQASRGVRETRKACGDRWLVTEFRTDGGFEGHGVLGWDAGKRRYTGVWVDGMRGFLAVAEGDWDPGRRVMTLRTEVESGGRRLSWRETTESVDERTQVWRQLMPGPGGEFEMMTVTYRRR